jgi:O-antigen biosynthesis protein
MSFDITQHWDAALADPLRLVEPASWVQHIPFAFVLTQLTRPRTLVELGVHTGNSFSAFCQAVRLFGTSTLCYGVDTFEGDEHAGLYDDHIFTDIQAHIQDQYSDFAQLMRMTFDQAAAYFSEDSIDVLHVDGLHTYEAVRHDYETWLPRMSSRAVMLFHDIHERHDDFGVWRLWDELRQTYPGFGFRHGHGLGVLAIGSQVPADLLSFLHQMEQDKGIERFLAAAGDRLASRLDARLTRDICEEQARRLNALEPHTANLEQLRSDLEAHCANLELSRQELLTQCNELAAQCNELAAHRDQLAGHADELEQQVLQTRAELDSLRQSFSWKVTKPLRAVGRHLPLGRAGSS